MSIQELIEMLRNRIAFLARERQLAVGRGDVAYVSALDADTATTNTTIAALEAALAGT